MIARHAAWMLGALTALPALALDIKGIQVDKPLDCQVFQSITTAQCPEGRPAWLATVSFLDGRATLAIMQTDGLVQSVAASDFNFNDALDALRVKFGEPKIARSTVQNKAGASFEQVEASWTQGDQVLSLRKHGDKIDRPGLLLYGRKMKNSAVTEKVRKAAAGASNI